MAGIEIDVKNSTTEELVSAGLKAYILRDYNAAVEALTQAIEVVVSEHGEKHDSLGNVYLHYGKALLEISREESEALGDAAVPQMDDESEDEEEENAAPENGETKANGTVESIAEKKDENSAEKKDVSSTEKPDVSSTEKPDVSGSEKPDEGNVEKKDETTVEKKNEINGSEEKQNEPSTSGIVEPQSSTSNAEEGETTEEKNEEATDLQVAWEVLELAKLIFEQRGNAGKKELADTLVTLGEVSVESENFDGAIVDIQQGLTIQKEIFDAKSRHLAGTYYKLAVALSLGNKIEESIENFNIASKILNDRLTVLKADEEQNKEEIEDIVTLIPEIAEKISDMKSYKEEAANKIASALISSSSSTIAAAKSEDNKFEAASSSGSASDISHLVKRKRKLDEIAEDCEENAAKKHTSA